MNFAWLSIFFGVLAWSAWNPHDYPTWWLEVAPALVGLLLLLATRRHFPLTPLCYWLILGHAVVLMVGGHYTYAEVPAGDWLRMLLFTPVVFVLVEVEKRIMQQMGKR